MENINRSGGKFQMFSIPLNQKMSPKIYHEIFLPFLQRNVSIIHDIFFTCRLPPFEQDAMGEIFNDREGEIAATRNALVVQSATGIKVCATFNNINVSPSHRNLEAFIKNFSLVYDAGVRAATIPHTHWALPIKATYPDLYLKNTVLRNIHRPVQVYELAKHGFDFINLDRNLMRDHEAIRAINLARLQAEQDFGRKISLSLLANDNCRGYCPTMEEHYTFNCNQRGNEVPYMLDKISSQTCNKWSVEDTAYRLKIANLPPWKADWDELYFLGIDIIKMHGRESMVHFLENIETIDRYADNKDLIFNKFYDHLVGKNIREVSINAWRKKIKTCQFECWSCNYCDQIIAASTNKAGMVEQKP